MATLKDVAKLACVDISTVSRALNNTSYVHPDTKARILAAVKELSYQPNVLAKGLREGKRHTIGVIVPSLHLTIFSEIIHSIEEFAKNEGYGLLICTTNDDPLLEKDALNRIRNGFVDGLIIASTGYNKRLIKDILANGLPLVQIFRNHNSDISYVSIDYKKCGYEATHYLYNKGCRNIGLINGSMTLAPYKERFKGYQKAINELDINEITATTLGPVNTLDYGYHCTMNLLNSHPNLDAIIAPVDTQAIGAIRAIKDSGLKIPDQIKIISLTGQKIADTLETSLSTMEMPADEIGQSAASLLLQIIKSKTKFAPQNIIFESKLVERESTK